MELQLDLNKKYTYADYLIHLCKSEKSVDKKRESLSADKIKCSSLFCKKELKPIALI